MKVKEVTATLKKLTLFPVLYLATYFVFCAFLDEGRVDWDEVNVVVVFGAFHGVFYMFLAPRVSAEFDKVLKNMN
jgi:hypothetical protein